MTEYLIARLYQDVRVKRFYGGTSEIMKLLIARTLEAWMVEQLASRHSWPTSGS